jgi:hypothetical protein
LIKIPKPITERIIDWANDPKLWAGASAGVYIVYRQEFAQKATANKITIENTTFA